MIKFIKRIKVLPNYLLDKNVGFLKKTLIISMLLYVFLPFDILPDPVLGFGFIDDAVLAVYIISKVSDELDKYILAKEGENIDRNKTIENVEYEVKDDLNHEEH
ncbi:MAG: hypothetical protein PWQ37_980 [Candidatus Petromonas sp.]|jgi:uncharacterized membrane protein YkvA (DUF1232 family)|nr:hypothetical protein [Candidatus Petromonas sp.]